MVSGSKHSNVLYGVDQARLDRRDPGFGFTQRPCARMYGVGAQDKVVIMRDSRAEYEFCIGLGLEFDRGVRRPEGHQIALLQLVRDRNGAPPTAVQSTVCSAGGW